MKGHNPTILDVQRLQEALAVVTAYDVGVAEEDFELFGDMVAGTKDHACSSVQALAQLAWLFLRSMEERGVDRGDVLQWYGNQFATAIQGMYDE